MIGQLLKAQPVVATVFGKAAIFRMAWMGGQYKAKFVEFQLQFIFKKKKKKQKGKRMRKRWCQ